MTADPTRELTRLLECADADIGGEASHEELARAILAAGWSPPADANAPGLREALDLCDEVIGKFTEHGHPGRPCLRTPFISTDQVVEWTARATELRALLVAQPDKAEARCSWCVQGEFHCGGKYCRTCGCGQPDKAEGEA